MTKEALKLALEALIGARAFLESDAPVEIWGVNDQAITAIKEALAQPEQEPKCGAIIEVFGKDWRLEYMSLPVGKHKLYTQQYAYTTKPQRTWVGLTKEERHEISMANRPYCADVMAAHEEELKRRNT